jgi:hypothetical protein
VRALRNLLVCGPGVQAAHRQVMLRVVPELVACRQHTVGHGWLVVEPGPDGEDRGPCERLLELMEHRARDSWVTGTVEGQCNSRCGAIPVHQLLRLVESAWAD